MKMVQVFVVEDFVNYEQLNIATIYGGTRNTKDNNSISTSGRRTRFLVQICVCEKAPVVVYIDPSRLGMLDTSWMTTQITKRSILQQTIVSLGNPLTLVEHCGTTDSNLRALLPSYRGSGKISLITTTSAVDVVGKLLLRALIGNGRANRAPEKMQRES
jgi:hypothetical protein